MVAFSLVASFSWSGAGAKPFPAPGHHIRFWLARENRGMGRAKKEGNRLGPGSQGSGPPGKEPPFFKGGLGGFAGVAGRMVMTVAPGQAGRIQSVPASKARLCSKTDRAGLPPFDKGGQGGFLFIFLSFFASLGFPFPNWFFASSCRLPRIPPGPPLGKGGVGAVGKGAESEPWEKGRDFCLGKRGGCSGGFGAGIMAGRGAGNRRNRNSFA